MTAWKKKVKGCMVVAAEFTGRNGLSRSADDLRAVAVALPEKRFRPTTR
jgi:hypothetical protein